VVPRRRLPAWCAGTRRLRLGVFAGAAGLGFMFVEIALLQRLTLLLGRPALSLAVTLAGLLVGAGVGAAAWRPWHPPRRRRPPAALPLAGAAVLLGAQALALPALWDAALGWPMPWRVALALGAGFVPGLLMGPALPLAGARLGRDDPAVLPWLWAINGAASAVGAALAVMLAMEWGGRLVLLAGAVLYLAMALLLLGEDAAKAFAGPPRAGDPGGGI
jgi:hypothetical protein